MEISGRVLREVEFRDRLRGYDTEEVDEFLEKVAVAVDGLLAELEEAREQASNVEERTPADDESMRRMLVLAQRTADLAIREAREEAASLVQDARMQADSLVASARDESNRLRSGAEAEVRDKVASLEDRRASLEREIDSLGRFVETVRGRLTSDLENALEAVRRTLPAIGDVPSSPPPPPEDELVFPPSPTGRDRRTHRDEQIDDAEAPAPSDLADVDEPSVDETRPSPPERRFSHLDQAAAAPTASASEVTELFELNSGRSLSDAPARPVRRSTDRDDADPAPPRPSSGDDPDEELWQRWARGADIEPPPEPPQRTNRTNSRGQRRGRSTPA